MSFDPTARHTRQILKAAAARLTGRDRGPDHDPDGRRRVPRRESFDVDDAKAKPWSRIGDGSVRQGLAHRDALLQTARELRHAQWKQHPPRVVREARSRLETASAELKAHVDGEVQLPMGRPVALRAEISAARTVIDAARSALRKIDVDILEALIRSLDFATGHLFPTIETIAERAGVHRNSVVAALKRLRSHGFISWVRRTIRTGNDGEFAPQREQTSNAYFFEHRDRMAPNTWQRYWQLLLAKLKRVGATAPPPTARPPAEPRCSEMRATLARVGALVASSDNAST